MEDEGEETSRRRNRVGWQNKLLSKPVQSPDRTSILRGSSYDLKSRVDGEHFCTAEGLADGKGWARE